MKVWPDGPGAMAERIRRHDWAATPLGPSADWPQSLRTMVDLMLGAPASAGLAWGPALCVLFNDQMAANMGADAEAALGRSVHAIWPREQADEIAASVLAGQARYTTDLYWDLPHRAHRAERPFGWFTSSWTPVRDETGAVAGSYFASFETTDRVLAERAQRARQRQQAFLLTLSDALRLLPDPAAIQREGCRLLGDHLITSHTYYVEVSRADDRISIAYDHVRDDLPSFAGVTFSGSCPMGGFPTVAAFYREGRPIAVPDLRSSELFPEPERAALASVGAIAWLSVPLIKRGEPVGALSVVRSEPCPWSEEEVALVAETGERIWAAIERARAEQAAREADARLRTMANAAPVLIWDADANGTVFANDHYLAFFGADLDRFADHGWTQFLHPDDAEDYTTAYHAAFAQRRPFTHEVRARRFDGQYRWLSSAGQPFGTDRYVGVSIDVTERRLAEERLRRNNAVLQAINRIFSATLGAASEEDLAGIALEVARDLTDSAFGLMGEIDPRTGHLDVTAVAGLGGEGVREDGIPLGRAIQGLYGPVLRDGYGLITNEPAPGPALAGMPLGHPPPTAFLGVPLRQGGTIAGLIGLANRPGGYRPEDLEVAEALAPAIRHALLSKRAEAGLRESETRFRQFAQASSDILWITDAETFAPEFASPALQAIYGLAPEEILGDARLWAAHVVPEDRAATFAEMERVRGGEARVYEFRILRPSDGAFRWIRNHGFPLFDEEGEVRRIGGISSDVTEARQAERHQRVLLAELQHRVRNIMALIRSIVMRTGERAESVDDYAGLVGGRLLTLARVQSRLTRAPHAGVTITAILRDEIGAQAEREDQYDLEGAEIALSPKAAEVLTLAVHELATNAVKHGALASARGRVCVRWRSIERGGESWLSFLWIESGGPEPPLPTRAAPRRRGFGSELIEGMLPYELGGQGRIELAPGGARCHLEFPLKDGASILETNAPPRTSVFGGVLDLGGANDLTGQRILVAEDDFYLACDVARALKGAGAAVLGPCASEAAALQLLAAEAPTGAVVDINLGGVPSFALARALSKDGLPYLFVTGYDAEAIPPDVADVPRLEKPVELRRVVRAIAHLLQAADTVSPA
ncbi:PAS domain-containing protein [Methylobacterium sp. Leaf118]|uniref:PAS domain-containing protein n=1 Tax=Methylobacterium sp. Leaf118 TaxID=2876562 RepID=UPI001E53D918|nr:PAS domain-containing protein [Methylobacterium sp. Leaf118]